MGKDLFISADQEKVESILGKIAGHVLWQVIRGDRLIAYGEYVSALGLTIEDGAYGFRRFDTTAPFKPLPGLFLDNEGPNNIQVAYRIFEHLTSGGIIDSERVGKCYCGRFFRSLRAGARKSRACSKAHQAILSSREMRRVRNIGKKSVNETPNVCGRSGRLKSWSSNGRMKGTTLSAGKSFSGSGTMKTAPFSEREPYPESWKKALVPLVPFPFSKRYQILIRNKWLQF